MNQLANIWEKYSGAVLERRDSLQSLLLAVSFIMLVSYLSASTVSAYFVTVLGETALKKPKSVARFSGTVGFRKDVNYRTIRKKVMERNIFNSEGEFPDETMPEIEDTKEENVAFNENAPCVETSLNLQLLGTIYLGVRSPGSVATIKEKGYNVADIYHEGDQVIGDAQASIFAIQRRRVVINHNGKKECLELKESKRVLESSKVSYSPKPNQPSDNENDDEPSSIIELENEYVLSSLGDGFSKILTEGRLVPYIRDGEHKGYKLIGAKSGSLHTKMGLRSGDVITGVNRVSMARPDQGFALYQSLSEEKEIRVEYLKKGKTPTTITIVIK